ncbi:hypothetical protein SC936_10905 [Aggregatibacter actinomycetemcomitans serotype e str. SC936]|nr:hypothetical protein SA3096_03290 [Aggregatibacter actinomycetemcomitans serotype e str. SA3096]KYK77520.1 hypothetical protein SC936_10905 [Aggregatibacter actinomycetemcomitans serotype e str. SC936]KYK96407.1 hypothetical protein ANH9776_01520 [Aggregatibacter actinomycetemcomitans serotype e str. ANH9776]
MHPADDGREDGHSATDTRSITKQSAVIFGGVFLGFALFYKRENE